MPLKPQVLQALLTCRFSPIGALTNLAFYASKTKDITEEDAGEIFDTWSDETLYPPERRDIVIDAIKRAIKQGAK